MATIVNAAPMAIKLGVLDQSASSASVGINFTPIHMALVPLFTQRGPTVPTQVASSTDRISLYGSDSFDLLSKWANHGTVLSNVLVTQSNPQFILRLKPTDAPDPATCRLSLEIVAAQVPLYERDADGAYITDSSGNPVPTGETVAGHILKWVSGQATNGIGGGTTTTGTLVSGSTTSMRYPIFEDQVSDFGSYGNNIGRRLWCATAKSSEPVDSDIVEEQGTALYRIQYVERSSATSTATVSQTIDGDTYVEFSFKKGAINTKIEQNLYIDNLVLGKYRKVNSYTSDTPIYGPVETINVYHSNIATILQQLYAAECAYTGAEMVDGDEYLINFFDGLDVNGNPYETILVQGALDGADTLNSSTTHYSLGGGDGTMDDAAYAALVTDVMNNFETSDYHLMDMAKYPITHIWDTGFDIATKKSLLLPMSLRKDIVTVLSTQDVNTTLNNNNAETSIATALRTAALQFPESEYYNTKTCRAAIIGHGGTLIDDNAAPLVPMTIDLADKVAAYMGAQTAVLTPGKAFDIYPNNVVTKVRDVNLTYKATKVRQSNWALGLTWVQQFDQRQLFYPAIQTVYDDDTSVLNSFLVTCIVAYCEKIVEQTWKQLTGRSDLTQAQFIEQSNALISDAVKGRFDNRVTIVPETFFDTNDVARGYSWSCYIYIYANVMKTVGTYTLITRRLEDLQTTS